MRILSSFLKRLYPCAAMLMLPLLCGGANMPENVVLQYHFIGATALAQSPSIGPAKKIFTLRTTDIYKKLLLDRFATNLAETLGFETNAENMVLLRPLLDNFLLSESVGSVGGLPGKPLDFVVAVRLDSDNAQKWQKNLKALNHGPGEEIHAETLPGWKWTRDDNSFWMVPAKNWLVLGKGESLASVESAYLQQIQQSGQPAAAPGFNCFEGDVDWPRLTNWTSLSFCPLKLARTHMMVTVQDGGFYMTGQVTYPEPIQWEPHPMNLPTNLVHEPLTSFVTGQNVEPFLKSDDMFAQLCTNPFNDQFYFWSLADLAFQSYAAWPVAEPSNTMMTLSAQAIDVLNPKLQELDKTELTWMPKLSRLRWLNLPLIAPTVGAAPTNGGPFLLAGVFPLTPEKKLAPDGLWQQFESRTNLVYYDWELTGPRVKNLITLTQVLPILQMFGMSQLKEFNVADKSPATVGLEHRIGIQERWLVSLVPFLGNTATSVTKTGPNELKVERISPFVFNSFELMLLSHWLTDTPASPIDWRLIPQAKMSGPGIPSH